MSALLVDEVSFESLRALPPRHRPADIRSGSTRTGSIYGGSTRTGSTRTGSTTAQTQPAARSTSRPAPCEWGVPIVETPRSSWRLTDRGMAVVLALVIGLFLAGVAVVVASFLSVSNAPVGNPSGASAVVAAVRG